MKEYIMITTTFSNQEEMEDVVHLLLDERLVSCCQIKEIQSLYHWKGKVENEKEYLVLMKTKKDLYKEVEKEILNHHSYEVPEIISYEITNGYSKYLNWIEDETKSI